MESYENNFNSQACSHNLQSTTYPLPDQNTNVYTAEKQNFNTPETFTFSENSMRIFKGFHEPTSKSDDKTPKYQPYYKASGLPKELISMFGALHCMLCDVQVESPMTAKAHYQGKAHIKKVKAHLITWCKNTGNPMPDLPQIHRSKTNLEKDKCSLCDVTFTSAADAEIHFSGKNHMKRLQNPDRPLKKRKNVHLPEDPTGRFGIGLSFFSKQVPILEVPKIENKVKPKYYCDMCSVQAIDENQLKQHLNGARHFKALKAKTSTVVPAPANPADSILASVCRADEYLRVACDYSMHRTPTGHYYCQVCNLTMNSEEQFTQHVESKKHKAKMPPKKSLDGTDNTYCHLCSSKNLKSTTIL